jgi:4'-phosphopantetheinyl transferase
MSRWLSEDERARVERMRGQGRQRRLTVARGILRDIISRYQGGKPNELVFHYGPQGKPELVGSPLVGGLHFNCSRSGETAVYAFASDRLVGVDLERLRYIPEAERIVAQFFSQREESAWRSVGPSERITAFLCAWTRKEAYLKAVGLGLSHPTEEVEVSILPDDPALVSVAGDRVEASRWSLLNIDRIPGHVGSLAMRESGTSSRTEYLRWEAVR